MAFTLLRAEHARPGWPATRTERRHIASQAAPIAMIALVNMGMSITDTLMAAGLGADALAAVAIASDFYSLLFYLLAGTIGGVVPLYAAATSRGESDQADALCRAGWFVVLGCAFLLSPLIWQAPKIFGGIGINPVLVDAGRGYCLVMALVIFPNAIAALGRARLTALERPGLLLQVSIVSLPLNAVGNWIFMSGFGDWDGFGAIGLAVSSLIVWSVIALALVIAARRAGEAGKQSRTDPGTAFEIDLSAAFEIVRVGLPIGIMMLAEIGLFLGATIYVGTFSTEDAAAHAIAIRLAGVTYAVSIGLNQATMVRVARHDTGDGRRTSIASAVSLAAFAGLGLSIALLAIAVGLSESADTMHDLGRAAVLAAPAVALLALMELFGPIGATADGVLRGQRDTGAAMKFALTGNWLIAVPTILLLTRYVDFGVTGLWLGLAAGSISSALMMCRRLPRHWHNNVPHFQKGKAQC